MINQHAARLLEISDGGQGVSIRLDFSAIALAFMAAFCVVFVGLAAIGSFLPIANGVSAAAGFFFGPAAGGLAVFVLKRFSVAELSESVNDSKPPHRVIDGFSRWREGDRIKLNVWIDSQTSHTRTLNYYGVTDDHRIAFSTDSISIGKIDPQPKNVIALPAAIVKKFLEKNRSLKRRMTEQGGESIIESVDRSNYDEYLSVLSEELRKLEDERQKETPVARAR